MAVCAYYITASDSVTTVFVHVLFEAEAPSSKVTIIVDQYIRPGYIHHLITVCLSSTYNFVKLAWQVAAFL